MNFRNYKSQQVAFSKNFNIIYGDNGQGKTNILEAIFLCASGRSHRTSRDSDLVNMDGKGYYVKIDFEKEGLESSIEISYNTDEKRKIRINSIPVRRIGDLIGNLNVIIFSPEDLMVIKEGPSERRRFIDITLSQLKPTYFYDLQQYLKILSHRNNLLKEIQNNKSLIDTLDIWNNNLIKTGSRIIAERSKFIRILSKYAKEYHEKLTNNCEELELKYTPSINTEENYELEFVEKVFTQTIEKSIKREMIKCATLYGPQRDDYEIYINGKNVKSYGSQGQQRTSVLSVKLAEIEIMKEQTGEYPILLLDDVMSELDEKRQNYLMENMKGIQTFITCTDKSFFDSMHTEDNGFYFISKGEVRN